MFHWHSSLSSKDTATPHQDPRAFRGPTSSIFFVFFPNPSVWWLFHGRISCSFNRAASFIRRPRGCLLTQRCCIDNDTGSLATTDSGAFDESNRDLWLNPRPTLVTIILIHAWTWVDTVARENTNHPVIEEFYRYRTCHVRYINFGKLMILLILLLLKLCNARKFHKHRKRLLWLYW